MKLRVGVVGIGPQWETRHRPALRALSDRFEVKAVYDQVHHKALQVAKEFNVTAVDGYRALAARDDVDAVLLLSGQWFGPLPIFAACDYGKAVYCASGMSWPMEDALRIRRRIEESGISFMMEFPRRQAPATIRLKELIATRLGEPRLLFCHMRVPVRDVIEGNRPGSGMHSGPAISDIVELIDWCSYVVGRMPMSVLGLLHSAPGGMGEDYQMMNLDFSEKGALPGSSAIAQISSGRYIPNVWPEAVAFRPPAALQVACENGIAFIDLPTSLIWFDPAGRHQESLDSERPLGEQLLSQFYRSVTSLVRNTSQTEAAFQALSVAYHARHSHYDGRRVFLDT